MNRQKRSFLSFKKFFVLQVKYFLEVPPCRVLFFIDHRWVIKASIRGAKGIADKGEGDSHCKLRATVMYYRGLKDSDSLMEKEERGVVAG